jgi:NAD(P)-dependent dehydrogenase (short-subunit alcohol dehydrogenase family)
LVTGAASGIGRACALRFAQDGASVVVADLPSATQGPQETVDVIRAEGGQAEFFPCDVSRSQDNAELAAHVVRRFGRLDFAHNNAGIGIHELLHETSDEDFDRVIAVNLRGTFLGLKHQIRAMLGNEAPHRGAIVNTSSNARVASGDPAERLRGVQARNPRPDRERGGRVRGGRDPHQRGLPRGDHDLADVRPVRGAPARDPGATGHVPVRRSVRGGRGSGLAVLRGGTSS